MIVKEKVLKTFSVTVSQTILGHVDIEAEDTEQAQLFAEEDLGGLDVEEIACFFAVEEVKEKVEKEEEEDI